jgi:hypothetical protein
MQQPERTHVLRFSAIASQLHPLRWGQAPTQQTTSGTHYYGCLSSPFLRAPSDILNLLPLYDPATIYRCNVDSCVATRHKPRQTLFFFPPSHLSLLEGISRCDRPSARTVNCPSHRAVVQCRPRLPARPRIRPLRELTFQTVLRPPRQPSMIAHYRYHPRSTILRVPQL